jgi:acyl-CoA synthetase (AMP-forming)/AMP-acid ligase II
MPRPDARTADSVGSPRSTTDYVRFHALHRPSAIALVNNGREITYAEFDRDLRGMTRALRAMGLPAGSAAAVECPDLYLHWLLLLACENVGVVTASFQARMIQLCGTLLDYVDLIVAEHEIPATWARKTHRLTQAWVSAALASGKLDDREDGPHAVIRPTDPQRIRQSSGTTGIPRLMLASRSAEEATLQNYLMQTGFSKESRFLITGEFSINSMYWRATVCLRLGATSILEPAVPLAQAIVTRMPTHVRLFQYQVKPLLDELPPTFRKPEHLTVMMGAGPLPRELREQIAARLTSDIVYTYNSNETVMIAVVDADGIGTLCPGADAEIVDEQDRPLPPGQVGRIRVKTRSMVTGYLTDPEASARSFRDGWFYTTDSGVLVGRHRLKILGRVDDVLNIGGLKFPPSEIEDAILAKTPVREAGATSVRNSGGSEELCIALVAASPANVQLATQWITTRLWPEGMGPVHFLAVDKLPRTETGKLQRHLLKAMFER